MKGLVMIKGEGKRQGGWKWRMEHVRKREVEKDS